MKLEVGMYVRLHGKIGKIEHICMCEQCKLRGFYEPVVDFGHDDSNYISVYWKDDLKTSREIINLIEVGDYVNGEKVTSIIPPDILGDEELDHAHISSLNGEELFEDIEIKSIVTKEQFESMSYKVN